MHFTGRPLLFRLSALDAQFVQHARLPCEHQIQLHAQNGQHGKQLSCAQLYQAASLEPGQRLGCDAGLCRYNLLAKSQGAPTLRDGLAKLLEGLHLRSVSRQL